MAFQLELSKRCVTLCDEPVLKGLLKVDNKLNEEFYASISYWDRSNYISQWKEALHSISQGIEKSAIITNMYNPKTANFICWWPMYLVNKNIILQNHILFINELNEPFNERKIFTYIPKREIVDDEGNRISEWIISQNDIYKMLKKLENE